MRSFWGLGVLVAGMTIAACGSDESGSDGSTTSSSGGTTSSSGGDGGAAGGAGGAGAATTSTGGTGAGGNPMGPPGSLAFYVNDPPDDDDYAQLVDLPPTFGEGAFTFELWVKLDASLPVGPTAGSNHMNWTVEDPMPTQGGGSWWYPGNFLLDGHDNGGPGFGTFDLQIYGEGRVRWLFNDSYGQWGVEAYPATNAPSILDDAWHSIATVRRYVSANEAELELWVDGTLIDSFTTSPIDMRQWWDDWSTFPASEPGWFFGAEKISATGGGYWDDYKGQIGELRFWDVAREPSDLMAPNAAVTGTEPGLVGWYRLDEGSGDTACDALGNGGCVSLFPAGEPIWNAEGPG